MEVDEHNNSKENREEKVNKLMISLVSTSKKLLMQENFRPPLNASHVFVVVSVPSPHAGLVASESPSLLVCLPRLGTASLHCCSAFRTNPTAYRVQP